MITIREIADDKTTISSTRWAFASVVKVDIWCIVGILIAGVVGHFTNKPFDSSFYASAATLLGVVTTLVAAPKALQGFEPKKDKPHEEEVKTEEVKVEDR